LRQIDPQIGIVIFFKAILTVIALCFWGCSFVSWQGDTRSHADQRADNTKNTNTELLSVEEEEEIFENHDEIANLIATLTAEQKDSKAAQSQTVQATKTHVVATSTSDFIVPSAFDIWNMSDKQCMAALKKADISVKKPNFKTPFVKTPLLLESPIEGVQIAPRWPKSNFINAVMDCRLIVALVNVARQAALYDVKEILFYSTYRPLLFPDGPCKKGIKGRKCRARKKTYEKAKRGKMSQHRRATAIDIRWFKRANGETVDVLEHYERDNKKPPCNANPKTRHGKFLKKFACTLHQTKTFNVILTPNANRDHHNHFHLDITPNAKWYIVR